jgi:hypothetical protein
MKNVSGVHTADQHCATYCSLRRTLKWWRKLFFWGLEVSIINAYILYVESCKNSNSNPMSHIKFRGELVMALVGDFRQGGGASTRGRTSTSDNQQRVTGMLHVIIPHPEKKTRTNSSLKGITSDHVHVLVVSLMPSGECALIRSSRCA